MFTIQSFGNDLELTDTRGRNKAGWFAVSSQLSTGKTENVLEWVITPNVKPDYEYSPIIQVSQVGYRSNQKKVAILEMDKRVHNPTSMKILRINETGGHSEVMTMAPEFWGKFLRYNYARFDFTDITKPGMYKLQYDGIVSHPFMIHDDIYKRHVWQPTLEYYLPVQMCHMRINHLVKVWHGLCHDDDALMAPVDHVHFDGYKQ